MNTPHPSQKYYAIVEGGGFVPSPASVGCTPLGKISVNSPGGGGGGGGGGGNDNS